MPQSTTRNSDNEIESIEFRTQRSPGFLVTIHMILVESLKPLTPQLSQRKGYMNAIALRRLAECGSINWLVGLAVNWVKMTLSEKSEKDATKMLDFSKPQGKWRAVGFSFKKEEPKDNVFHIWATCQGYIHQWT